ncbi:MAG: PAS domain S-box protein, partial [Candidatus Thorarchaeota archaeon]
MNTNNLEPPESNNTDGKDLSIYNAINKFGNFINDMIVIVDENFKIMYINKDVHKRQAGYDEEDLIGHSSLEFIHPDDIDGTITQFKSALETGEGYLEVRIRKKDGTDIWTETKGKSFIDDNGKTNFLLISRDI